MFGRLPIVSHVATVVHILQEPDGSDIVMKPIVRGDNGL